MLSFNSQPAREKVISHHHSINWYEHLNVLFNYKPFSEQLKSIFKRYDFFKFYLWQDTRGLSFWEAQWEFNLWKSHSWNKKKANVAREWNFILFNENPFQIYFLFWALLRFTRAFLEFRPSFLYLKTSWRFFLIVKVVFNFIKFHLIFDVSFFLPQSKLQEGRAFKLFSLFQAKGSWVNSKRIRNRYQ